MTTTKADEIASLVLLTAAAVVLVTTAAAGIAQRGRAEWFVAMSRITGGANTTVGALVLLAVLVIVLTPGDEIAAAGQLALRSATVLGAVVFLGAVLGSASIASRNSTLWLWTTFVIPRLVAIIPAGVAVRLANGAVRGA